VVALNQAPCALMASLATPLLLATNSARQSCIVRKRRLPLGDTASGGKSAQFTLASGQNVTHMDAGAYQSASVGDFVWNDANRDGLQSTGEAGISGATATLFTSGNVQVGAPQTTGVNGAYAFSALTPGTYYVQFTLPAGYTLTPKLIGTDTCRDSDADPADSGKTSSFTLTAGQSLSTVDAGGYQGATVGDFVGWIATP